ncbi:MAG: hypothetical protein Fur0012_06660 [Elusimicrobiota bacterium]
MAFWTFLTKIPWGFLISKGPSIAEAVKNLRDRNRIKLPEQQDNFSVLEKLVVEQAHLLASLSEEVNCARAEIERLRKEVSILFTMLLATGAGIVVSIVCLIMVYMKVR